MSSRKFAARFDRAAHAFYMASHELMVAEKIARGDADTIAANVRKSVEAVAVRRAALEVDYERLRQLVLAVAVPTEADEVMLEHIARTSNDLISALAVVRGVAP